MAFMLAPRLCSFYTLAVLSAFDGSNAFIYVNTDHKTNSSSPQRSNNKRFFSPFQHYIYISRRPRASIVFESAAPIQNKNYWVGGPSPDADK